MSNHEQEVAGHFVEPRMTRVGIYLYGWASFAAGVCDLLWGDFDASHQPIQAFGDHIPGRAFLAYITATWMIAGGIAILWRRSAQVGAAALSGIYLIFAVFWLPRLYTAPLVLGFRIPVFVGVSAGAGSQLIAATAGAVIYASLAAGDSWRRTIGSVRWIFGLCSIDFGLGHLTDIRDNLVYVPRWLPPGQEFWVILTGICFVLAGLGILSGIRDVLAARLLAIMLLIFNIVILPVFIFADPKNHASWGGYAYNLAAVASAWILGDALASCRTEQEHAKPRLAEAS
jgi:uncharacterized membrane protein YphA (DoxX/SURF4 family)